MTRRVLLAALLLRSAAASAQVLPLWAARQEVVVDGAKADLFGLGKVHVDPAGRIYAGQHQNGVGMSCSGQTRYRVFDSTGAALFTVGRCGSGPGEFGGPPMASGLVGDSLWMWDSRRIHIFAPDGRPVRSFTFNGVKAGRVSSTEIPKFVEPLRVAGFDGRTVIVDDGYTRPQFDSLPILRVSPKQDPEEVLGWAWGKIRPHTALFPNPPRHALSVDASRIAFARAILDGPDAGYLYLRVVKTGSRDTVRSRFPVSMVPISAGRLDSAWASVRSSATPLAIARLEQQPNPVFYPPLSALWVARDGGILIRFEEPLFATPERDYLLVSPAGSPIARFKLPPTVSVQQFDGRTVWSKTRDANGFESIVRYQLEPPKG